MEQGKSLRAAVKERGRDSLRAQTFADRFKGCLHQPEPFLGRALRCVPYRGNFLVGLFVFSGTVVFQQAHRKVGKRYGWMHAIESLQQAQKALADAKPSTETQPRVKVVDVVPHESRHKETFTGLQYASVTPQEAGKLKALALRKSLQKEPAGLGLRRQVLRSVRPEQDETFFPQHLIVQIVQTVRIEMQVGEHSGVRHIGLEACARPPLRERFRFLHEIYGRIDGVLRNSGLAFTQEFPNGGLAEGRSLNIDLLFRLGGKDALRSPALRKVAHVRQVPDRLIVKKIREYERLLPHGPCQKHLSIQRIGAALHCS